MNQDYNDGYEAGARRWAADNDRLRAELAETREDAGAESKRVIWVCHLDRAEKAEAAIARAREVIRELHVPGQTSWHWSDIETALDGDA